MGDLAIYVAIVVAALALGVAVRLLIVVPRRRCLQCGAEVPVSARNCRRCGYRYASAAELATQERASSYERRESR
jgi:predicted amidophosphoribosyltransferase